MKTYYQVTHYDKTLGQVEYWTGAFIGPRKYCRPVLSLDSSDGMLWEDADEARAAMENYDPRMHAQGFEVTMYKPIVMGG